MKLGKLTNEQLQRCVLDVLSPSRTEVVLRASIGEDCAALDLGDRLCVVSTDPITAAHGNLGRLAIHICCNDAASSGAEPIAMLLTLMAPPQTTLEEIESIMRQAHECASALNVEIIGGHTEITAAVNQPILSGTVLAAVEPEKLIKTSGGQVGDALVMTKSAGLEGMSIIVSDHYERARRYLTKQELDECAAFGEAISVIPEGLIAASLGAHAMHDVTEGGVLGAVHELCSASGCGVLLEEGDIAVAASTRKLCHALHLDPLRLLSSGCMLIACEEGEGMVEVLRDQGIDACVIGTLTHRASGLRIRCTDQQIRPLGEPQTDELYKLDGR